jgi:hypothetical protein
MNDKEIKGLDDLRVWLDGYAMEFAPYNTPVFVSISGHNFCIERMEIQQNGPFVSGTKEWEIFFLRTAL